MLDLARPHLIQAHANAALRERLHDVLAAVEAGLDDVGEAIVVTDAHDRVAFSTEAGRAALALLDGRTGSGARMPEPLRSTPAPAHAVLPVDGGSPLMVRRLTPRDGDVGVPVRARRPRRARSQLVALGLSPREAEVLQAMMRGHATAAIATQLEISPRTIHKHAQSIYAKLGVNDRIAAVSAAWAALDSGFEAPALIAAGALRAR